MKKCNLFYLSGLLFFLAAALNFFTGENHSTAVVWLCLSVSGVFAAEKIKHSCSPGGGKIWPGLQFFAGVVRIPDRTTKFRQKTRYAYVNQTDPFHCCDPL